MKASALTAAMFTVLAVTSPAMAQLNVAITVDNAYGFGFGPASGMTTYYGGIRNVTAGEIYSDPAGPGVLNPVSPYTLPGVGAELYTVPSPLPTDYVYIVAWSDKATWQGALAGFQVPGGPLLGSGAGWTVFATGINRNSFTITDTLTVADLPLINSEIALANANGGGAGTSVGWVDQNGLLPNSSPGVGVLALGALNVNGAFHGVNAVPGISNQAQWMWFDKDPVLYPDAFTYSGEGPDGHDEFLIFREQVSQATPEPSTLALLAIGGLGLLGYAGRRRHKRGRGLRRFFGTGSGQSAACSEVFFNATVTGGAGCSPAGPPHSEGNLEMKSVLTRIVVVGFSLFLVAPAQADWNVGDPAKYFQLPDLSTTGMDVNATWLDTGNVPPTPVYPFEKVLADDFPCTMTGPITGIHIWGSWLNDAVNANTTFHLSIHADVPANSATGMYSYPGAVLWQENFTPGNYIARPYATAQEQFYDPNQDTIIGSDTQVWQYNFAPLKPFVQQGTAANPMVYWLDVQAWVPATTGATDVFGWKTSLTHWGDDAVFADTNLPLAAGGALTGPAAAPVFWQDMHYPAGTPYGGQSIDQSFVITTTPEPGTLVLLGVGLVGLLCYAWRKWK